MPEGPEHFKAAMFINKCCGGKIFTGKIIKSEVNIRNPDVEFNVEKYTISAKSRGKELMLTLSESQEQCSVHMISEHFKSDAFQDNVGIKKEENNVKYCQIVFQFGMSGSFEFTSPDKVHKHSHLRFFTDGRNPMVLSFVDVRRFGKWRLTDHFSTDRGPDPVSEYNDFRRNVLTNLDNNVFQKPICEVLHNQKYFNGLGNYLRAEILYRAKIPPFDKALNILNDLPVAKELNSKKGDGTDHDILELCSLVPYEAMMLDSAGYYKSDDDHTAFESWLQCYCQNGMRNLVDHDGRTIWFKGPAGSMAPAANKAISRHASENKTKTSKANIKNKSVSRLKDIAPHFKDDEIKKNLKRNAHSKKNEKSGKIKRKECIEKNYNTPEVNLRKSARLRNKYTAEKTN